MGTELIGRAETAANGCSGPIGEGLSLAIDNDRMRVGLGGRLRGRRWSGSEGCTTQVPAVRL